MGIFKKLFGKKESTDNFKEPKSNRQQSDKVLTGKHDFIAFDFETANSDQGSICQIGIAVVGDGRVLKTYTELVNPEAEFDFVNISVHGITEDHVENAPVFPEVLDKYRSLFQNNIAVSHSSFDKTAINQACEYYEINCPLDEWVDSMRVVRRAWPDDFGKSGYGLRNVADTFGIEFGHHDAGEDARAAALIMLKAIDASGSDINAWMKLSRIKKTIYQAPIRMEGNPNGDLAGAIAVFTGELSMSRKEAATLAAQAGVTVASGVTKKTTMLVVGVQDLSVLAGHNKSSKHRKAETYISNGQSIRIISEVEFRTLIESG